MMNKKLNDEFKDLKIGDKLFYLNESLGLTEFIVKEFKSNYLLLTNYFFTKETTNWDFEHINESFSLTEDGCKVKRVKKILHTKEEEVIAQRHFLEKQISELKDLEKKYKDIIDQYPEEFL